MRAHGVESKLRQTCKSDRCSRRWTPVFCAATASCADNLAGRAREAPLRVHGVSRQTGFSRLVHHASLKSASCLSKFTQTWREKPANSSDLVQFSGKSFRHGEKIRLHVNAHETTPGYKVTSLKVCLKNAKNLCLGHRFFDEIRQIHRFFDGFRQNPQILCRNQARAEHTATCRETRPLAAVTHKKTRYPHEVDTGRKARLCR